MIIQATPYRSATMPNRGEKNVLLNGICTSPPSARAVKTRSAVASSGAVYESEKPSNFGYPVQRPSEAMIMLSPIQKLACMTLFSDPGAIMLGSHFSGLSLKRSNMSVVAPRTEP